MNRYRTDYPNQVHQLAVGVSKHLYVATNGKLKYQIKPFEISLTEPPKDRSHIIIFAIRDYCSGISYAEVGVREEKQSLVAFLARAWKRKSNHVFCGVPEALLFTGTAETAFPGTSKAIDTLGVELLLAKSGFQTNIGDIKVIENRFKTLDGVKNEEPESFGQYLSSVSSGESSRVRGKTKIERWESNVNEIVFPPQGWGDA